MRPILIQGKRQFREDGSHLTQDDLFDVPDDLQANELVKQFWCVFLNALTLKNLKPSATTHLTTVSLYTYYAGNIIGRNRR